MKILIILFSIFLLFACVQTPNAPDEPNQSVSLGRGAFILCEGLKGIDNSTVTKYDANDELVINDFYGKTNPNYRLGDTSNDIVLIGDTAIVAVTGSKTIEMFSVSTGKELGRIRLSGNHSPRHIAVLNDSLIAVTHLYGDLLAFYNIRSKEEIRSTRVGANPEGIAYLEPYIFAANSGLGALNQSGEKAGTVSIIDKYGSYLDDIYCGANMQSLAIWKGGNQLIATYNNTYMPDSIGGIVTIDLSNLEIVNHRKIFAYEPYVSESEARLYFIEQNPPGIAEADWHGISYIDLRTNEKVRLIENTSRNEYWYAFTIDERNGKIWIANAMNFVVEGEVIIYDLLSQEPIENFKTGINPNKIVFY